MRPALDRLDEPLVLVSHALCPYVQRVAIVLHEKGVAFERRDVDLARKPDWFLRLSPLGKTPVLQVGREALFESVVICEYLEDTTLPRLHPVEALARARHRGWVEFSSALLNQIAALYNASDDAALNARVLEIRARLTQVESALGAGPFFAGPAFSLVDAAFAPAFRYFEVLDEWLAPDLWNGLPRLRRWRSALAARPSVQAAVRPDYRSLLRAFLRDRSSALSLKLQAPAGPLGDAGPA